MKSLLLAVAAALVLGASSVRADDVADARKAFDMFIFYSRTGNERMLDLFANDISVTFTYDTPSGARDKVLPPGAFVEAVRKGMAKKDGNSDTYEDIQAVPEGGTVRLTCTRTDGKTGEHSPFVAVYVRDATGALKMEAMKMKVPPPKVKPGQ